MTDCNAAVTPFDVNQTLSKPSSIGNFIAPYQQAIGSLLFLVQGTRPDLAYAISILSKYNNWYDKIQWTVVKRVIRTVIVNKSGWLLTIETDWASDSDNRCSRTGYVFLRNGNAMTWKNKQQLTVALSTTEAEYMALSSTVEAAEWLRQFEKDFWGDKNSIQLYCNNRSALDLTATDAFHARTKYIDVRHHFVRQKVNDGHTTLAHVNTGKMIADALTKLLSQQKLQIFASEMGIK